MDQLSTVLTPALLTGIVLGLAAVPAFRTAQKTLKPGGKWTSINRPTAEPRHEETLPEGKHPLQLYSLATPNGQKVTIALEEMGLKYDAYLIDIMKGDQFSTGFVAVNPNGKIPAMIDREGPGGKPVRLFESGSILLHLAEKSGSLLPKDPALRIECMNWLFFQVGAAPYFGQYGHFKVYAPVRIDYAVNRYEMEVKRILSVLQLHLAGGAVSGGSPREWLVGKELSIADVAWFPWVRGLEKAYKAAVTFKIAETYPALRAWLDRIEARPAVQRGLKINSSSEGGIPEYHSK